MPPSSSSSNGYVDVLIGVVWIRYNPLKDNDQMVEMMEKHLQRIEVKNVAFGKWEVLIAGHEGWGKTINEAACNAGYMHFKELKG